MLLYSLKSVKLVKYLIEGIAVITAAYFLTNRKTDMASIFTLGIVAGATLMILDQFAPNVAMGARLGSGFSIGRGLIGRDGEKPKFNPLCNKNKEGNWEFVPETLYYWSRIKTKDGKVTTTYDYTLPKNVKETEKLNKNKKALDLCGVDVRETISCCDNKCTGRFGSCASYNRDAPIKFVRRYLKGEGDYNKLDFIDATRSQKGKLYEAMCYEDASTCENTVAVLNMYGDN